MPAYGRLTASVCAIRDDDSSVSVRHRLEAILRELVERLPHDLGLTARAAFGMGDEFNATLLSTRIAIAVSLSLPRAEGAVGEHEAYFELVYGGTLVEQTRATPSRFTYTITLPRSLARGETHEYGLRVSLPEGQPMRPHYVFVPERPCDEFGLHVRFHPGSPPRRCWVVEHAFHRDTDDSVPTENVLRPDSAGEITTSFRDLMPGFGYGLQWMT